MIYGRVEDDALVLGTMKFDKVVAQITNKVQLPTSELDALFAPFEKPQLGISHILVILHYLLPFKTEYLSHLRQDIPPHGKTCKTEEILGPSDSHFIAT